MGPRSGLRVVGVSAFIAAPIGGMILAQLGAEVIRIDPIGGNIDYKRWPLSPEGTSLYWTGLNKAKRSVTLALNKPEGQEIARALICAPGEDAGILLTNLPASGWMSHAALSQSREDLIMLRLGEDSDAVLSEVLGLSSAAIGRLHDAGVVAGPDGR
jgi:2-methylfumaryl-CoA isomerase